MKSKETPRFEIFVPHLKQLWAGSVPYGQVKKIILDKDYESHFRAFMLDAGTKLNDKKGFATHEMSEAALSIAQDNTERAELRRYALLQLRKQGAYEFPAGTANSTSQSSTTLQKIFNNPVEPGEVRGAVLTAMRRTGDPQFKNSVILILSHPEKNAGIVVQHALIDAALGGIANENIKQIISIAQTTTNPEVYASAINSLGITGSPEAVKAITSLYGKFNNPYIGNASLERNTKVIISMLDLKQPLDTIQSAITAADILKFDSFIEPLKLLVNNTQDQALRDSAAAVLNGILANPQKSNPKWEVN